jgi:hypothetical protein
VALLRLLAVCLLLLSSVYGSVVTAFDCCTASAVAAALSDDHRCCDGAEGHAESESEGHCPCPLPCAPGCSGHGLRALCSSDVTAVMLPPAELEVVSPERERRPPCPERPGILHVPKPFRA